MGAHPTVEEGHEAVATKYDEEVGQLQGRLSPLKITGRACEDSQATTSPSVTWRAGGRTFANIQAHACA
jgi:hypothetical protein